LRDESWQPSPIFRITAIANRPCHSEAAHFAAEESAFALSRFAAELLREFARHYIE
jgi:hypothetical protein